MQGDGVFAFVFEQKSFGVAEHDCARIGHFGVKPCVARNLPCHVAVVAVGPIEHGGDGKGAFGKYVHILDGKGFQAAFGGMNVWAASVRPRESAWCVRGAALSAEIVRLANRAAEAA